MKTFPADKEQDALSLLAHTSPNHLTTDTQQHNHTTAKKIRSLAGQRVFALRLHHFLLTQRDVVVVFHRVNSNATTHRSGLLCSVEISNDTAGFSQYFLAPPLQGLVEKMEAGAPLDREPVITFDDGCRDNYKYAAPVLKETGLPATFLSSSSSLAQPLYPSGTGILVSDTIGMTWNQVCWLHNQGFEIGSHTQTSENSQNLRTRKRFSHLALNWKTGFLLRLSSSPIPMVKGSI